MQDKHFLEAYNNLYVIGINNDCIRKREEKYNNITLSKINRNVSSHLLFAFTFFLKKFLKTRT